MPAPHAALAELKGVVESILIQIILLNTLGIQEAKDSSSVENLITTYNDLYKANLEFEVTVSPDVKEVQNYMAAMKSGFQLVQNQGLLTNQTILKIQETLEGNFSGFRKKHSRILFLNVCGFCSANLWDTHPKNQSPATRK